jgi:molybdopterin/thiamine biosynthesis adenylyltransferase
MALADYFSKDLLAITQALKKGANEQFREILNNTVVGIAIDAEIEKAEGRAALDLTVRLLSRLYPKLRFINLAPKKNGLVDELVNLSISINSKIEIVQDKPSLVIAIGRKLMPKALSKGPTFYVGSDGWTAKFSTKKPVGSGNSLIPFGAGFSACIGVSNIFRFVFRDFIDETEFDDDFSFSLIGLQFENNSPAVKSKRIDLGHFILVGFGAIGNGAVWALSNAPFIKGKLTIVEPENIEITNLQRYVLADERHIKKPKIDISKEYLNNALLKIDPIQSDWASHLNDKNDWANRTILVAIDNVKDRIRIQSSLPEKLINSYTEKNVVGISRHLKFDKEACLVCTYLPSEEKKSYSQEVSDNLGLPLMEPVIRNYLFYLKPADELLIRSIAEANSIDYSQLEKFLGIQVSEFYARVVCGGLLMELRKDGKSIGNLEAPLAFQSAMAGILLVTELILTKAGLRKNQLPTITQFFPLHPLRKEINPYHTTFSKDRTGRCICNDEDFINVYKNKWG